MTTEKGIYYPNDYSDVADIPADMKEMAESIDDALTSSDGEIEGIKEEQQTQNTQINNNKTDIEAIKTEQTEQNTGIQANTDNITALLEKIDYIEGLIPTGEASGESLTLSNTARYPFKEFNVGGNTIQDGTPTPEAPIPVENVSGEVEVKVENKNLFDNIPMYVNTSLQNTGIATGSSQVSNVSQYIKVKENTSYTLSLKNDSNSRRICFYTKPLANENIVVDEFVSTINYTGNTTMFTIPANCNYIRFGYYNAINTNIQLEEGSTATSYEPHEEQTAILHLPEGMEMCKIGDYKDTFVEQGGKWYKNKVFQKVIFDGTENWKSASADWHRYYIEISDVLKQGQILSDYFIRDIELQDHNKELYGKIDTGYWHDGLIFIQDYKSFTTLAEFKAWLSSHNTTVYYQLKEPVLEEITDSTLISDLESLKNLYSYKGTTHISSSNEPSPVFEVVYRKSLG